jgi:hypothetical protein
VLGQVIAEYAEDDAEVSDEIMDLRAIVQAAGPLEISLGQLVAADERKSLATRGEDTSKKLAELFLVESGPESPWRDEDYFSLWQHQLDQPLESMLMLTGTPPNEPSGIFGSETASSQTIKDLLHQASPSTDSLRGLKDAARSCVRSDRSDFPGELATALYFACIAVGITRRRVRITKSEDAVLEYGFRLLVVRPWLDDTTRRLVQSALEQIRGPDNGYRTDT